MTFKERRAELSEHRHVRIPQLTIDKLFELCDELIAELDRHRELERREGR